MREGLIASMQCVNRCASFNLSDEAKESLCLCISKLILCNSRNDIQCVIQDVVNRFKKRILKYNEDLKDHKISILVPEGTSFRELDIFGIQRRVFLVSDIKELTTIIADVMSAIGTEKLPDINHTLINDLVCLFQMPLSMFQDIISELCHSFIAIMEKAEYDEDTKHFFIRTDKKRKRTPSPEGSQEVVLDVSDEVDEPDVPSPKRVCARKELARTNTYYAMDSVL